MEQQEENWQIEHIALCRDGFGAALAQLEGTGLAAGTAPIHPAVYESGEAKGLPADWSDWLELLRIRIIGGIDAAVRAKVPAMNKAILDHNQVYLTSGGSSSMQLFTTFPVKRVRRV